MSFRVALLASSFIACLAGNAIAQSASSIPPAQRRAFFGELHLHTTFSLDAWTFGTKITPDLAYKFGKGETVMVKASQIDRQGQRQPGTTGDVPARRAWPLDFMAVTDHAESFGTLAVLDDPTSAFAQSDIGKRILSDLKLGVVAIQRTRLTGQPLPGLDVPKVMRETWDVEMKAANDNYEPGKFTTFIAYEFTASPGGKNLHRNVIFNSDHAPMPFTSVQSKRPEDLWTYLEKVRSQGIDVLAIPHNGNASGGLMYDWNDSDGRPIDNAYALRRALNEPLTEIVQTKGQSDTAPVLSPNDEFANFEVWDHLLIRPDIKSEPHGSYIREALGRGLVIESKVGANPFKFGVVGASDIHNGLSTSDETAWAGGMAGIDPKTMMPRGDAAKRILGYLPGISLFDLDAIAPGVKVPVEPALSMGSAGITGVWAEENTRNSIFAALRRKETFATSGTRIRLRMFAGWNYDPRMLQDGGWVTRAYAEGVPMGSDLPAMPASARAPAFILQAVKDPDGANLDRVQIIKLWLDGGSFKEKIFDVVLSGRRRSDPRTGLVPKVGNTVDLKTGRYRNTIGSAILTTVWRDPEFDPKTPAVYYARALEIPTPRWSTLLAIRNHLPLTKLAAATIQERAWSSPIWFSPTKQ